MFGYVKTDLPNMYVKDTVLYKALYCGLCKGIGKCCGTCGRFTISYDLTFLSAFIHNALGKDVDIQKQRCILHRIKKRPVAVPDDITYRIARLNVILAYRKVKDDVIDEGKGRAKSLFIKGAYNKAVKKEKKLDEIVKTQYAKLLKLEKENCDSIDKVSDPFGVMMQQVVSELLGDKYTDEIANVSYSLGKWIYLIDALDDFDKDKKKNSFNVFVNVYNNCKNKEQLLKENGEQIVVYFSQTLSVIYDNASKVKFEFNHDLIDNILLKGLYNQTKIIMENKKCKKTTKSYT